MIDFNRLDELLELAIVRHNLAETTQTGADRGRAVKAQARFTLACWGHLQTAGGDPAAAALAMNEYLSEE